MSDDEGKNVEVKPKSIKQIREMRKKEPKILEDGKNTLIVKGSKTSDMTSKFMKDIKTLKKQTSVFYSRRNDTHPFEKMDDIQSYCKNTNSSLFLFGSNTKKRPHNIVIGRMYEHMLLDMVELGIQSISGIDDFENLLKVPTHTRPALVFQGDAWETNESLSKVKNILHDFFVENIRLKQVQINNALRLTITFSVHDNHIYMRTFEVLLSGPNVLQNEGKLSIQEVGPKVDFILRRTRFADDQVWKQSVKIHKPATKKQDKNLMRDNMGDKRGRLYVDRQNYDILGLKKTKALQKKEKLQGKMKEMEEKPDNVIEEFQA